MPIAQINLEVSAQKFSRYYRGQAHSIVCTTLDGRTVQFPAAVLRPFLAHEGVHGIFEIEFSDKKKFINICKIS